MADPFSITVSVLALAVSSVTAWLTLFRRGTVKMTQPTVIYFGPDTPRSRDETPLPKVYLRTLLFATSKRGRVVESMHVALSRNETHQNFNIWVYGDASAAQSNSPIAQAFNQLAQDLKSGNISGLSRTSLRFSGPSRISHRKPKATITTITAAAKVEGTRSANCLTS